MLTVFSIMRLVLRTRNDLSVAADHVRKFLVD